MEIPSNALGVFTLKVCRIARDRTNARQLNMVLLVQNARLKLPFSQSRVSGHSCRANKQETRHI